MPAAISAARQKAAREAVDELAAALDAAIPASRLRTIGYATLPNSGNGAALATTRIFATPAPGAGRVKSAIISAAGAGNLRVSVISIASDGGVTVTGEQTIAVPGAGVHTIAVDLPISAGQYIGLQGVTAAVRFFFGSGLPIYSLASGASVISEPVGSPIATNIFHFGFVVDVDPISLGDMSAKIATLQAGADETADALAGLEAIRSPSGVQTVGYGAPANTGSAASQGITRMFAEPALASGRVSSISFATPGAGDMLVQILSIGADGKSVVVTAEKTISAPGAGVHTIALDLPIAAGQYVGLQGVTTSVRFVSSSVRPI